MCFNNLFSHPLTFISMYQLLNVKQNTSNMSMFFSYSWLSHNKLITKYQTLSVKSISVLVLKQEGGKMNLIPDV